MNDVYYVLGCFGCHITEEANIKKLPEGKTLADIQKDFNKNSKDSKIVGWQRANYSRGYWKIKEIPKKDIDKTQIIIDGILCDIIKIETVKITKRKEAIMVECVPAKSLEVYAAIAFGEIIRDDS